MRRSIPLIALVTLTAAAACGSDATAPANPASASVAGNWILRTINGNPLPFSVQVGANRVDVIASTLTMTDGGSWTETPTINVSVNGGPPSQQVTSANGIYIRAGQALTLTSGGVVYLNCTFDGSHSLGCQGGAVTYAYAR